MKIETKYNIGDNVWAILRHHSESCVWLDVVQCRISSISVDVREGGQIEVDYDGYYRSAVHPKSLRWVGDSAEEADEAAVKMFEQSNDYDESLSSLSDGKRLVRKLGSDHVCPRCPRIGQADSESGGSDNVCGKRGVA